MDEAQSTTVVIGYSAKSTDDTRGSMQSQEAAVRRTVLAQGEREVVGFYSDEAQSAWRSSRPDGLRGEGLAAAFAHCADLAAQGRQVELWVFHSDRLARGDGRQAAHLGELYFRAHRLGFELRSVEDDQSLREPIFASLMGERNSGDSKAKSGHVRAGKARQRENGKRLGGPIPWGFAYAPPVLVNGRVVERPIVPHPERAPVVIEMFERSAAGDGDHSIALWLNSIGVPTTKGNPWLRRTVQDLLARPTYAGLHKYDAGTPNEMIAEATDVTPIVSRELWNRAQRQRAARDRSSEGRARSRLTAGRPSTRFLLYGLATCARCGSRMYSQRSPHKRKDGTYKRDYLCRAVHGETGLCDAPKVDAEIVDVAIIPHLQTYFADFHRWATSVTTDLEDARASGAQQLEHLEQQAASYARTTRKAQLQYERACDGDDDAEERAALSLLTSIQRKIDVLEQRRTALEEYLDRLVPAESPAVALARWWDQFAAAIRGITDGSGTVEELNRALRDRVLARVDLEHRRDGTIVARAFQITTGKGFDAIDVAEPFLPHMGGTPKPVVIPAALRGGHPTVVWPKPGGTQQPEEYPFRLSVEAEAEAEGYSQQPWEPWHWGNVRGC